MKSLLDLIRPSFNKGLLINFCVLPNFFKRNLCTLPIVSLCFKSFLSLNFLFAMATIFLIEQLTLPQVVLSAHFFEIKFATFFNIDDFLFVAFLDKSKLFIFFNIDLSSEIILLSSSLFAL